MLTGAQTIWALIFALRCKNLLTYTHWVSGNAAWPIFLFLWLGEENDSLVSLYASLLFFH